MLGVPLTDRWAQWLLHRRHGGDQAALAAMLASLQPIRDRVLDAASIRTGDRVLDVGCGDGLLGFGALERLGPAGTVVFADVSTELLARCRELAEALPAQSTSTSTSASCEFVHSGLPELAELPDAHVDVAMTRSVLIYVRDKAAAFDNLFRVLRPGGRLSIFEPINRFIGSKDFGYDVTGCEKLAARAYQAMAAGSETLTDFDERDLLAWAIDAGFTEIRLSYEAEVGVRPRHQLRDWATLLQTAPNPNAPTFGEVLETALTADERAALTACLRPQVEAGARRDRMAVVYLCAVRPG